MQVTRARVSTDAEWNALRSTVDRSGNIEVVGAILRRARELGAISILIEEDYLDQDFTAEFSAFYSKIFKRYSKLCRRLHFFACDIEATVTNADPVEVARGLNLISERGNYLGFVVVRPVAHAPIARTVLAAPPSPADTKSDLLVRSKFEVHLLGANLSVTGIPFMQQDGRISACAQAAVWMCGRHFHSKHRGPWISAAEITDAATKPTDHVLSQSLPAGSRGLTFDHMSRALRAMGREPFFYIANLSNFRTPLWSANLHPQAIIDRYVDSGIPVIIGLSPWDPAMPDEFHAVVATGHSRAMLPNGHALPARSTRAEFCKYFLVNDDQRGTNLRLPVDPGAPHSEVPYSIANVAYLLIPLPGKVYIPAETAETLAWGMTRQYVANWPNLKATHGAKIPDTLAAGDQFVADMAANRIVARTYLTYGWRYKQRMIYNTCAARVKEIVADQELPKYVWVTEFGTIDSLNHLNEDDARIVAHVAIDATSSHYWDQFCIFHGPGMILHWHQVAGSPAEPNKHMTALVPDDHPYRIKIRGRIE